MTYTHADDRLTICATAAERELLKEIRGPVGEYGETNRPYSQIEVDALEPLLCNSELEWIRPEEIGALTSAPILGLRGDPIPASEGADTRFLHVAYRDNGVTWYEPVTQAWGFMDYALRSFVDDLIDTGEAVFTN